MGIEQLVVRRENTKNHIFIVVQSVLPFFFNLSDFLFPNFQPFFSTFQNSIMDDDEP
jgi:hypothetical protein